MWAMHKDLEIIMLTFINENVFIVVQKPMQRKILGNFSFALFYFHF
jgi:hypothetical protein